MAELVGTVASAAGLASLALQIGQSIVQLKAFYSQAKRAPKDLRQLVVQLNNLNLHIQELRTNTPLYQALLERNASLRTALSQCRECVDESLGIAEQLQAAVKKNRTMGSLKTVLKADELKHLCDRLGQATQVLMFSCMYNGLNALYLEVQKSSQAVVALQPITIATGVGRARVDISESCGNPGTQFTVRDVEQDHSDGILTPDVNRCTALIRKRPRPHQRTTTLRIPLWFASQLWELQYSGSLSWRTTSEFSLAFRTRNIIPRDSPIFDSLRSADVEGVKELFDKGQASPYDIDDRYGYDALTFALRSRYSEQVEAEPHRLPAICEYLLTKTRHCEVHLDHLRDLQRGIIQPGWNNKCMYDTTTIILSAFEANDNDTESELKILEYCWGPSETVDLFVSKLERPLQAYPLQSRVSAALRLTGFLRFSSPQFLDVLQSVVGCSLAAELVCDCIVSLSHAHMGYFLGILGMASHNQDPRAELILTALIRAADALNLPLSRYNFSPCPGPYETPANWFIKGFIGEHGRNRVPNCRCFCQDREGPSCYIHRKRFEAGINKAIRAYVACVAAAGVDLKAFGRAENEAMRRGAESRTFPSDIHSYSIGEWHDHCLQSFSSCRILRFEISSQSEEWKTHCSWQINQDMVWEELAGDFWNSIDETVQHLPGAWGYWEEHNHVRSSNNRPIWDFCNSMRKWFPSSNWRRWIARENAAQEAGTTTYPEKELFQMNKRRLREGAIRYGMNFGYYTPKHDYEKCYEMAYEISDYWRPPSD